MSVKVWMSGLPGNYSVGLAQGLRTKYFGYDWEPASLDLPLPPPEVREALYGYIAGAVVERSQLPEAAAVWSQRHFRKVRDVLTIGGFYAVRRQAAKVLGSADLGAGGLVPCPVYKEDLKTTVDDTYFIVNFGSVKDTIIPSMCGDAQRFYVNKASGKQVWKVNQLVLDAPIALNRLALNGPDLWIEERVSMQLFMVDALAQRLMQAGVADVFDLRECIIIDRSVATESDASAESNETRSMG